MSSTIFHATRLQQFAFPDYVEGPNCSRPSSLPRETSPAKVIDVGA